MIHRRWPLDHPAPDVHAEVAALAGPPVTLAQVKNRANGIGALRSPGFRSACLAAIRPAAVATAKAVVASKAHAVWPADRIEAIRGPRMAGASLRVLAGIANAEPWAALRRVSPGAVKQALKSAGITISAEKRRTLCAENSKRSFLRSQGKMPRVKAPAPPRMVSPPPSPPAPVPEPLAPAPAPVEPQALATGHVPLTFAECVAWVRSKGIPQDARAGIGFDGSNVAWLNRVRALYCMAPVVVVEDRRVAA